MVIREVKIFLTALMFYTRLPCGRWIENPQEYLNATARYFPLVGWLVGGAAGMVFWAAHQCWPASVALVLSLMTSVLLTGALHEDGLMDACDGFGGGWTRDRILAIMKDSHIGAFGGLGMLLLVLLKLTALHALPASVVPLALFAGHSLSRFAAMSLLASYEYARADHTSKAGSAVRKMARAECAYAAVWGISPVIVLAMLAGEAVQKFESGLVGAVLLAVGLARWGLGRYFFRAIGGYTGDCLGAVQQVTEVLVYLLVAA